MLLIVLKKDFFKLMNNSVYCKTMENLRKIIKVRLVKWISRRSFVSQKILNKICVAFHETKTLVYEVKTNDIYEDFYENENLFEFSNYPQDLKFFDPVNKKVIGKMKDEFKKKIISEFVGLKSKMYFLIDVNHEKIKKAKGVNKNVVKSARHKELVDVLFNKKNNKR